VKKEVGMEAEPSPPKKTKKKRKAEETEFDDIVKKTKKIKVDNIVKQELVNFSYLKLYYIF